MEDITLDPTNGPPVSIMGRATNYCLVPGIQGLYLQSSTVPEILRVVGDFEEPQTVDGVFGLRGAIYNAREA